MRKSWHTCLSSDFFCALMFLAYAFLHCVAVWPHVLPHGTRRFKIFRKYALRLAAVCYSNRPSAMPVFASRLDPNSAEFLANFRHHQQLAEELRGWMQEVGKGGTGTLPRAARIPGQAAATGAREPRQSGSLWIIMERGGRGSFQTADPGAGQSVLRNCAALG